MRKKLGVTLAEATCSAVPSSLGKSPRKVVTAVNSSKVLLAELRRSKKSALENGKSFTLRFRMSPQARTSRSGLRYGSGRSSTASVTLKIAVLAPMPSAMVATAVSANAGLLRNVRHANERSLANMLVSLPVQRPANRPMAGAVSRKMVHSSMGTAPRLL
jgi:hypothetical protein